MKIISNEASGGGVKTPNRQGLYAYAARYSKEAIDVLVKMMRTSRNENLKLGAARALLDKCLPDLRAQELSASDNGQLSIRIVGEKSLPGTATAS